MQDYFKLFSSSLKTKGVQRSLITDVQRNHIFTISNDLYDFLETCENRPVQDVLSEYDQESQEILTENMNFLKNNELAFFTNNPSRFPKIDKSINSPYSIDNCIIDYNETSDYSILNAINLISDTNCKHFQFRFFSRFSQEFITDILLETEKNDHIETVEFIIHYDPYMSFKYLEMLPLMFPKIRNLVVYSSPDNKVIRRTSEVERSNMGNICTISDIIKDDSHCGVINPFYATFNRSLEKHNSAVDLNSCLNRKIGVDINGSIKNCPSTKEVYGNISNIKDLDSIVSSREFKSMGEIGKANIKVCKVCEFRDICSDCRTYTTDNERLGKPEKCNYDPFKNVWN
jgi:SPASM domain peptide maturase of grasp-with-spasm system